MDIEKIIQQVVREVVGKLPIDKQQSELPKDSTYSFSPKAMKQAQNIETIQYARSITPARIGIGRTGTRMTTEHYLDFRVAHAAAQDAVLRNVDENVLKSLNIQFLKSSSTSLKDFLMNLDSGRKLDEPSKEWLAKNIEKNKDVQIIISDGLSSSAIEANIPNLLPALLRGLSQQNISTNEAVFVERGRVWIEDEVAKIVQCQIAVILIGERPGLNTAESLSAYIIYKPNDATVEADRTVISNIHENGLAPTEAGAYLSELIKKMLDLKCSGVQFMKKNQ